MVSSYSSASVSSCDGIFDDSVVCGEDGFGRMRVSSSLSVVAEDGEVVSEADGCSMSCGGGSSGSEEGGRRDDRRVWTARKA